MFKMEILTEGSAFRNNNDEEYEWCEGEELRRILRKVADDIVQGCTMGSIMDINGNKIGSWSR